MTNASLLKAHYDIIYKNVVRKSDSSQMDLNSFFDALEEVGNKLHRSKNAYDNMRDVITTIQGQL